MIPPELSSPNAGGGLRERGPIVDVRARWRAGWVALGFAALMTALSLWRPLETSHSRYLRLFVTLGLGLGVAGTALFASLRGRGRHEQLAFYWFVLLAADGLGQMLGPLGWPRWPLPALLLGALAVAETLPVALGLAGLLSLLAAADAAHTSFADWKPALAATLGYGALVLGLQIALLGEKRRLSRTQTELDRLRFGFELPETGEQRLGTVRGQLRLVSEQGRRALHEERAHELELMLQRLVRVARLALKAHAVLYFEIDRERELARVRAWDGPVSLDAAASVPLAQDPFAFVLERRVPFYATDFKRLLWELSYYKEPTKIGTLLAVPVLVGDVASGLLLADRLEVQSFTADEPEVLEGFAAVASDTVQKTRAAVDREESGAEFKAVYAVSEKLAIAPDSIGVRSLLLESARQLAEFEAAAFAMVDDEQTRYTLVEAHGWAQEFEGREVGLMEKTWAAWVLRGQEEAFLLDDVALHRDKMPILVLDEGGGRAESLLAIPLKVGRGEAETGRAPEARPGELPHRVGLIGVFVLTGRRKAFGASARRVLSLLANQAAATLYHIQLKDNERRQAVRDGLTRLQNRRAFDEELVKTLAREDRRRGRFALLLSDLDHFKKLNDTYGHPAGDAALRSAARVLQQHVRGGDFAARYGGEEFAVILPGTSEEGARQLAERIRRSLEQEQVIFEGARVELTVSLGVSEWPRHGKDAASLLAAADRALYAAKQAGRNRVVIASSLEPPAAG